MRVENLLPFIVRVKFENTGGAGSHNPAQGDSPVLELHIISCNSASSLLYSILITESSILITEFPPLPNPSSFSCSSSSSSSTTQGWAMFCCSRDCVRIAKRRLQYNHTSGMLGGQAVAPVAEHIAEACPLRH